MVLDRVLVAALVFAEREKCALGFVGNGVEESFKRAAIFAVRKPRGARVRSANERAFIIDDNTNADMARIGHFITLAQREIFGANDLLAVFMQAARRNDVDYFRALFRQQNHLAIMGRKCMFNLQSFG